MSSRSYLMPLIFGAFIQIAKTITDNCQPPSADPCLTCQSGYYIKNSRCIQKSSTDVNLIVIICVSLAVAVILGMLIIYTIKICRQNTQEISNRVDLRLQQMRPESVGRQLAQQQDVQVGTQRMMSSKKWHADNQFNYENDCAVCLQTVLNVQTYCLHGFHSQCILQWRNVSEYCPVCRTEIRNVKVYCQRCHKQYQIVNLDQLNGAVVSQICDIHYM